MVILFAALASGTAVTIGFGMRQKRKSVIEGDTKAEILKKAA